MKKILCIFLALLILTAPLTVSAANGDYNFNLPYYSYTYDSNNKPVITPSPYSVAHSITGAELGISEFSGINDLFYSEETTLVYITDQVNNRIVIINKHYELVKVLDSFDNNGTVDTFLNPSATYVKNGLLYVSDTDNMRIVCFDAETYELVKIYDAPKIPILGDDYLYYPTKIAVDLAGRIYVIGKNVNQGIILLDQNGEFAKLAGAPDVSPSLLDMFWRLFMTDEQKAQLEKPVPTEYNSIHLDKDGFIYVTTQSDNVSPISKLNSQGKNVLKFQGTNNPDGDSGYSWRIQSIIVDVAVRGDGIYAALDTTMNRIFVYDQEGSLLYAFGGQGSQEGTFYNPSSIEMYDDIIMVSDRTYNSITVFQQSEFGGCVDKAVTYMIDGDYPNANAYWHKILTLCPSYDAAYIYLARVDIQNKEFDAAIEKLEGTGKMDYYSKAFKGAREELIRDNFTWIFIGLILLIILILVGKHFLKKYKVSEKINSFKIMRELNYSSYVSFHPFDGFWDLKREKRGSMKAAHIMLVLFIITYALRAQYSGYLFIGKLPNQVNVFLEVATMIGPILLWVVSNWCFTTLMEGEGNMKDIYIATMYSLRPYIITAIPMFILSHCLSLDEAFIYTALDTIITIWMLALMFFGMMTTHDYTLGKGFITAILTLVGIILMIFLALVFTNVINDIISLVSDMIKELSYRTY